MTSKKTWGNACWYLFHSLAFKLHDDNPRIVNDLLTHIKSICGVLPCPDCSMHATQTLNRLRFDKVKDRETLVQILFEFHNIVNKRVGNKLFTREEHDNLYKNASLPSMYNHFTRVMSENVRSERAMMYNLSRKNRLQTFDAFIKANAHCFLA